MIQKCDIPPEGNHAAIGTCNKHELCGKVFELTESEIVIRARPILELTYTDATPIKYLPLPNNNSNWLRGVVSEMGLLAAPSAKVEVYENETELIRKHQSYANSVFVPIVLIILLIFAIVMTAYGIRFTESKRTRAVLIFAAIFRVISVIGIWIAIEFIGPCWSQDICNAKISDALQIAASQRAVTAVHLWRQPTETKICGNLYTSQVYYMKAGA